jgi:hypothetical protein
MNNINHFIDCNPQEVDSLIGPLYKYSVCTMVTNFQEYHEMIVSFTEAGFGKEFTQFLYVDNSKGNKYDAYQAVNQFLKKATGSYLIICHQDILLKYDNEEKLFNSLEELNNIDEKWAIAGNAGGISVRNQAKIITEFPNKYERKGPFPSRVHSLDENFLVIKNSANLSLSADLQGFHLYGFELCLIASILGYNSYVIDFHLFHKSQGNPDHSFYELKQKIIIKYSKIFKGKFFETTITNFYLSGNGVLNSIFNSKFAWFWLKHYFRPSNKKFNLKRKISNILFKVQNNA